MRYLIFDSEAVALDALALIDQRGRDCFAAAGYTVREDGAIIGKRAGEDDPAGITVTWDTPRQRIDGKMGARPHRGASDAGLPAAQRGDRAGLCDGRAARCRDCRGRRPRLVAGA
ncbi:hypothetical protein ACFSKM_27600 [Ancylobacter dichloromethanicus]